MEKVGITTPILTSMIVEWGSYRLAEGRRWKHKGHQAIPTSSRFGSLIDETHITCASSESALTGHIRTFFSLALEISISVEKGRVASQHMVDVLIQSKLTS